LHAIGNYYQEKHPNAHVLYITTDAFIDEFVKYVHGKAAVAASLLHGPTTKLSKIYFEFNLQLEK